MCTLLGNPPTHRTLTHLSARGEMGEVSEGQMPFVNKQGVLKGAPSGVLTHPRDAIRVSPLYLVYGVRRGEESGPDGADTEELWV
ncbi:hypothetical protein CesoFtcFv8_013485 [Champsocephalus esox]|uniref:Uncharacterized protein n=1 Tax=Champsocephalus esox TaxID=159716 RepID=A0AAN8BQJ5_9TELE|nr:hypothetical protein CesoFtcFv8_013485 [Champsocephalus esox]